MSIGSSVNLRPLSFSNDQLRAVVSLDQATIALDNRAIAVNAGSSPATIHGWRPESLHPMTSTQLRAVTLDAPESMLFFEHDHGLGARDVVANQNWVQYRDGDRGINLWRSAQDKIGNVSLEIGTLLENQQASAGKQYRRYSVCVNLWFAPARTNCLIHNSHPFIEIHTQIVGLGHMQKFRSQDPSSLYEDVTLAPGATTERPFCLVSADGTPVYPWHQYYAETDCIWLAIEYHPFSEADQNA